ncbi:MAG: hypothetical protein ACRDHF_02155 [Tepidiformaceae bacterium]
MTYPEGMAYDPEDLDPLELALLGVLSVGLPPSRTAGDNTFRVDHVTAVVAGLAAEGRREAHLAPDGVTVIPDFRRDLRATIEALTEKGLVAQQPVGMPAAAGGFEAGLQIDLVDPDEHPALLDRYLGQLCMEALFNIPAVYPYLMERYSASGEVWRRVRESGYQR